jgi:hypothetical protein
LLNVSLIKSKQQKSIQSQSKNTNNFQQVITNNNTLSSTTKLRKHKIMKIIVTSFALFYATSTASASSDSSCSKLDYAYPNDIPWVEYKGDDYIFTRQKYNSVCVDSNGKQFEYGTIIGEYPPIDTTGSGCSTACVKGISVDKAKGCNQRPPSNRLVGFQYDCERAECKCLYEAGTLSNQYERCFDDMNLSNQGNGQVYGTKPQQGETCYSLYIQQDNPPPTPTPPVGASIPGLQITTATKLDIQNAAR